MEKQELRLDRKSQLGSGRGLRIERRTAARFPLHAHDYYELEVILEGTGWQWINGVERPIQRGSTSMLSPADFHEIHPESETVLWNISFDETFLPRSVPEALLTGAYQTFQHMSGEQLGKLDMAAHLLLEEYHSGGATHPLVEYILSLVIHSGEEERPLSTMEKAVLYVDTHFRENPSLAQVAKQVCLSPVYFGSLFKKYTGDTYVNYLNMRKVKCARMLLESGISVTECCYSAGFGSLSGFLRAFKQSVGISPCAYRMLHRKEIV